MSCLTNKISGFAFIVGLFYVGAHYDKEMPGEAVSTIACRSERNNLIKRLKKDLKVKKTHQILSIIDI
jgi:hypothetical protein